jgi:hypothetical protein
MWDSTRIIAERQFLVSKDLLEDPASKISLRISLMGLSQPQSNQSAGPVRFLIFCSISIILLASQVAGRKPLWTAGTD